MRTVDIPGRVCDDCGAPVLTDSFEVRNPEMPGEAVIVTQGICTICEKVMSI